MEALASDLSHSTEEKTKAAVTAQELLDYSENDMVAFMSSCHTTDGRFLISRITNFTSLPPSEFERLNQKLAAAAKLLKPLEVDSLRQRLEALQQAQTTENHGDDSSQTVSPPPELDAEVREALAHDRLVQAGGWPVIAINELRPIAHMSKQSLERAALFVELLPRNTSPFPEHCVPHLFTAQLDEWNTFKHMWQWCNRGKAAAEKGFAEFLAVMRDDYLRTGEQKMVANKASFEAMAKRIWEWEYEKMGMEASNGKSFSAYARAVEKRLDTHHFDLAQPPFQLRKNPRQQDKWTTGLEYLNFTYWQEDCYRAAMDKAQPGCRRAMQDLLQLADEQPAPGTKRALEGAGEELAELRAKIEQISRRVAPYMKYETRVSRHQLRAQWMLQKLQEDQPNVGESSIREPELKVAAISKTLADSVDSTRRLRKRKARHDQEEEEEEVDGDHTAEAVEAQQQPPPKRSRIQTQAWHKMSSRWYRTQLNEGIGLCNPCPTYDSNQLHD